MRAAIVATFLLPALLASPPTASAQVGVGIRAGTLGLGADVAFALSPNIQIRGGGAIQPVNPTFTISDITYTVNLPGTFANVGIDFFPTGGGFRIGGGLLYKPDDLSISGKFADNVDIGGRSYTDSEVGMLTGTVASKSTAPYAMIGFGKHASSGIGLFLDLGAAFVGEQTLTLTATGTGGGNAQFLMDLESERLDTENSLNKVKIYPMVNLGLRIGVGG
jgi:hypothetical protein